MGINKPVLNFLYHDGNQIKKNCFIAQLYEVLQAHFSLVPVSLSQLREGRYRRPTRGQLVFSVLKQRSYKSVLPFLARYLTDTSLIIYDQDPWEAYHDSCSSPGLYPLLHELLPIDRFLVTSGWWADFIKAKDALPVSFVRMGVLARNCDLGPDFNKRRHPLGFQGTLHRHRADFVDFLARNGKPVQCLPSAPYDRFLRSIQDLGIFIHDEYADVFVDGEASLNGIWIKDIEVAARGCFAVRNIDLDKDSYDINELPTIFTYKDRDGALEVLDHILSIPDAQKDQMRQETVARIKERNDWMTVVNAILEQR